MKIQQNTINLIKEVLNDASSDALRKNTPVSVVYVDTLQELIVVESNISGEEYGWQPILEVSP
jgi:precorrin-4 methylase